MKYKMNINIFKTEKK